MMLRLILMAEATPSRPDGVDAALAQQAATEDAAHFAVSDDAQCHAHDVCVPIGCSMMKAIVRGTGLCCRVVANFST
jgi:hypothetical protein